MKKDSHIVIFTHKEEKYTLLLQHLREKRKSQVIILTQDVKFLSNG